MPEEKPLRSSSLTLTRSVIEGRSLYRSIILPRLRFGFILVACVAGCGPSGPKLYLVTGSVTLDGQPLPQGFIGFDPADGKGNAYAGEILDGKFKFACEPGGKKVSIRASRPSKKPGPDGGPDFEQYLPPRYNTHTTLSAQVEPRDTNADVNFDLRSK